MKHLNRKTLIAATVIGLGLAGAGLAAASPYGGRGDCLQGGGMPHSMGMYQGGMHRGGMGGPMGMDPQLQQQRMQRHLGAVEQALNLSEDQQAAWNRFAASHQARMAQMQAQRQAMAAAAGQSAPQRMAARSARMEQRLAQMKQAQAELEELYAALTPEQRATADQMLGPRGHGGRRPF